MSDQEIQPAPVKSTVTLADLEKIDIRVGTILAVEDVSGSNRLVRLIVDFGDHQRSILAGMKQERTDLQSIKGQQALFVVNLEPRKIMGETSTAYNRCSRCRKVLSRMEPELDENPD
jgi:methionine--tRNA ligase beta chain